MRALIVSLILAASALAAECGNCQGTRVVGMVPLFQPCPSCLGSGTVPDSPARASGEKPRPSGRPRPAVCRVVGSGGPSLVAGSGVLVRVSGTQGLVLTAWHVVRGNRDAIEVTFPEGVTLPAKVVAWDQDWDLAALAISRPEADPVAIAAKAPRKGEPLTCAGYGQVGVYRELTGAVTDFGSPTPQHPEQFVEVEGTARSGDSGGPIFDERGEVAGILFGQARGKTIGSCSTRLHLFLAEAGKKAPACMLCEAAK